jgi:predicted transcriptional regulator of viral defense system
MRSCVVHCKRNCRNFARSTARESKLVRVISSALTVIRVLANSSSEMTTRDVASRSKLMMNEARWACGRLVAQGLVRRTKRRVTVIRGNTRQVRILLYWSVTESGRTFAKQ